MESPMGLPASTFGRGRSRCCKWMEGCLGKVLYVFLTSGTGESHGFCRAVFRVVFLDCFKVVITCERF